MTARAQYETPVAPVDMISADGGMIARVICGGCGSRDEWRLTNSRPAPSIVQKHFTQKGWQIRKMRMTCPSCIASARIERAAQSRPVWTRIEPPTSELAAGLAAPLPTDAAKMQRRLVYVAIEDGYDEAAKRYRPGHTDATVAKVLHDGKTEVMTATCECQTCATTTAKASGWSWLDSRVQRMFLCPTCGNKRCPHANHHVNACTGSNEPGQPGSAYE